MQPASAPEHVNHSVWLTACRDSTPNPRRPPASVRREAEGGPSWRQPSRRRRFTPASAPSTRNPRTSSRSFGDTCEARGWQATEYVDKGVSGDKDSRPAVDTLVRDRFAGGRAVPGPPSALPGDVPRMGSRPTSWMARMFGSQALARRAASPVSSRVAPSRRVPRAHAHVAPRHREPDPTASRHLDLPVRVVHDPRSRTSSGPRRSSCRPRRPRSGAVPGRGTSSPPPAPGPA